MNQTNKNMIDANDPKWTAYALNEITDERERMEMEAIIRQSPEIAAMVEEIRETAGLLKEELIAESAEKLTPAQRERIEEKAAKNSSRGFLSGLPGWKPAWGYAIAAAAVIVVALFAVKPFWQIYLSPLPEDLISVLPEFSTILIEPPPPLAASARSVDAEPPLVAQVLSPIPPSNTPVITEKPEPPTNQQVPEILAEKISVAEDGSAQKTVSDENINKIAQDSVSANEVRPNIPGGLLSGRVADASNAVVSNAIVTAKNVDTNVETATTTNIAGVYNFSNLQSGAYTLVVEAPGFQRNVTTDIMLRAATQIRLNLDLAIMGSATEVEVTSSAESMILEGGVVSNQPQLFGAEATTFAGVEPGQINITRNGISIAQAGIIRPPADRETSQAPNWRAGGPFNTETYDSINDNPFLDVTQNPLSTFSIDVDTASYSNMRRFLNNGSLPPRDSIRIEELVNYFDYDYSAPRNGKPFAVNAEMTEAPWNPRHRLLRIGIKGREIAEGKRPDSNLVFLIDVSGSMSSANRLPLVKESMKMLVDKLTKSDRVAIVIYAGDTRLLLPSTRGDQKATLRNAIDGLRAGGSTNGASGIQLAYQTAQENFIKGGVNRIILATDGDFNVGVTNRGDLTRMIEEKAKSGIFLSALGFGMNNYKDATLEMLADKGRGNYAYIDTESEARKVLVEQMNSTLVAIAADVKIQVEFNPARVASYRLLGYENRVMAKEDFNDDTKMAGVIGAGHTVTAFYELELAGESEAKPGVDPLRYQNPPQASSAANSLELATVKIRSKKPEKEESELTEYVVNDITGRFSEASGDFKFAVSVAAFGMMLRDSPHKGDANFERVLEWAREGVGKDSNGYREEFIRLVHRAASLPRR